MRPISTGSGKAGSSVGAVIEIDKDLVARLDAAAVDAKADPRLRQAAVWALGRSGRQDAACRLVALLTVEGDEVGRCAASALADLSGLAHGTDAARWTAWWDAHKDLAEADWLQGRLAFQAARSGRLDGELLRARAQVVRLHQQVFARLAATERVDYVQSLLDQDEPGVRGLAVIWCIEMLPSADADRQASIGKILQRLTHDGNPEVQRTAVLALGRLADSESFVRLRKLLADPSPPVKAAAIRVLALRCRAAPPRRKRSSGPSYLCCKKRWTTRHWRWSSKRPRRWERSAPPKRGRFSSVCFATTAKMFARRRRKRWSALPGQPFSMASSTASTTAA